ncbi:MAG: hypothetical protein CL847_00365 [Crocinitomicaceae bacterium]|nr:hypothetical protein [Crocinitomicaceae bacterium]
MTKKKILLSLLLLLLVTVGGVSSYVLIKGDVWKELALKSINDNITTSLIVDDVEVSILSSFPQISVDLKDVRLVGAPKRAGVKSDTLISVNKLGVAFSLWDVVFGDPVIRSIYLENGALQIEEFAGGKWNYEIASKSEDSSSLEISSIHLTDIDFTYIEKGAKKSTGLINKAEIRSDWLTVSFEDLNYDGISDVFIPLYGEFRTSFSANEHNGYSGVIENGVLADLDVSCEFVLDDKGGFDVWGHFASVSKDELRSVFLEQESFEGWTYGGRPNLFFFTDESVGRIDFKLPEAEFAISPDLTGLSLNNKGLISGEGRVDLDYKRDVLGFSIKDGVINSNGLEAELSGSTPSWGSKPVDFDIKATLDLGSSYLSWIPGVNIDTESVMPSQGAISINTLVSWLPTGGFTTSLIQAESSSIKGNLNSNPYTLSNVLFDYSKDVLKVDRLNYNWAGNVGEMTCHLSSVDDLIQGGAVLGSVQVDAESILVDPLFSWWENRPDSEEESLTISLLQNGSSLSYSVNSDILIWDGLECTDVSSRGEIGTKTMRISFAKTQLLDGEATIQGQLKTLNNKYSLGLVGSAEGFLISDMFRVYENFGQDFLRAEHLEGRGDVSGSMNLVWDREGNWESNSFDAELQASVSNGRLKSLEVFDAVADYLKENRLIAPLVNPEDLRKRLSDIKFDYVETPVSVSMSTVSIPFTNIKSSAMNVSLEGAQTFAGEIDYTLGFALRDLRDNKQGEFGNIQDDGLGNMFFLGMDDTLDEPVFSYDRKAHKAHRRRAINAEAQRIKDAFKKEEEDSSKEEKDEKSKHSWKNNPEILDDPEDDDF